MRWILALILAVGVGGCASLQPIEQVGEVTPAQTPMFNADSPLVVYQRAIVKRDVGVPNVTVMGGWACVPQGQTVPATSQSSVTDDEIEAAFQQEFKAAGYRIAETVGAGGLFTDKKDIPADLRIGAIVTNFRMNVCFPNMGFGDFVNGRGEASLRAEFQVYSDARKSVIYTSNQLGYAKLDSSIPMPGRELSRAAFARAVRGLLADQGFVAAASSVNVQPAKTATR